MLLPKGWGRQHERIAFRVCRGPADRSALDLGHGGDRLYCDQFRHRRAVEACAAFHSCLRCVAGLRLTARWRPRAVCTHPLERRAGGNTSIGFLGIGPRDRERRGRRDFDYRRDLGFLRCCDRLAAREDAAPVAFFAGDASRVRVGGDPVHDGVRLHLVGRRRCDPLIRVGVAGSAAMSVPRAVAFQGVRAVSWDCTAFSRSILPICMVSMTLPTLLSEAGRSGLSNIEAASRIEMHCE